MANESVVKTGSTVKNPGLKFLLSLAFAIGMVFLLKEPQFTDSQLYVIFLLFFAISLWITEAIPAFAVSLFIIAFLVFAMGNKHFNSAPENIEKYASTFSSAVIWLMLGGFFLAAAMKKTKLDVRLFQFAVRISGTIPKNLLFGLMITTMITSMVMSSAAATAMVIAAITPLISALGKNSGVTKALLLGVPLSAMIGGMGTIIGTPSNAIAVGQLNNIGIKISFLDWMIYAVPIAIVITTISALFLRFTLLKDNTPIPPELIEHKPVEETRPMKIKRRIVISVLVVTVLLWLASSSLEITVASVTAVPLVVLTLTKIITTDDVRSLPWDTLLLVAGGLSLGVALQETRLLNHYTTRIASLGLNSLTILFVLAYLGMVIANFMSASASVTVLIPIAFVILPSLQKEAAIILPLATSTGMFLPVSDIPNSIAYSTGYLDQKDFLKTGRIAGLIGPPLIILWVLCIS